MKLLIGRVNRSELVTFVDSYSKRVFDLEAVAVGEVLRHLIIRLHATMIIKATS